MAVQPIHSNIKVRTIVNIMRVNQSYVNKIKTEQQKCDYYETVKDYDNLLVSKIKLKKEEKEYQEFLDFYV